MALYLIVVQAHFIMNNIFEGMIWFFLPASLVITNDIFAYICGITFGRTQLIKLSPKKTVEGFMGAWACTIVFGYFITNILVRYKYFICPVTDLGSNFLTGLECTPNPVFTSKSYKLPDWTGFGRTFDIAPMQFHILVFATFASLIAPFGGFFASGLKRTFKIKDFGESIPGHGGITDRMDCQFIMGFFAYMYYHSFIALHNASVGDIMEIAINGLTVDEQFEVIRGLSKYLYNQGAVSEKVRRYGFGKYDPDANWDVLLSSWHALARSSPDGEALERTILLDIADSFLFSPFPYFCRDYLSFSFLFFPFSSRSVRTG